MDAGTSDDSGRASEQLHGSGLPRDCQDADSSRDHLSDVSPSLLTLPTPNPSLAYETSTRLDVYKMKVNVPIRALNCYENNSDFLSQELLASNDCFIIESIFIYTR